MVRKSRRASSSRRMRYGKAFKRPRQSLEKMLNGKNDIPLYVNLHPARHLLVVSPPIYTAPSKSASKASSSQVPTRKGMQRLTLSMLAEEERHMREMNPRLPRSALRRIKASYEVTSGNARAYDFGAMSGGTALQVCEEVFEDLEQKLKNPKLVKLAWLQNQCRWVIWKCASLERRFPRRCGGKWFTAENLKLHLHRRFEREIVQGKRPALKILLNGDMSPKRYMIVCVSRVPRQGTSRIESSSSSSSSSSSRA